MAQPKYGVGSLLYMTFLDFESLLWVAQPVNTKQEKINHLPGALVGISLYAITQEFQKISLKFDYINGLSHKIVNRIYLSFKLIFNCILYLSFENPVNIRKASWSYSPLPLFTHLQHFLVLFSCVPHFLNHLPRPISTAYWNVHWSCWLDLTQVAAAAMFQEYNGPAMSGKHHFVAFLLILQFSLSWLHAVPWWSQNLEGMEMQTQMSHSGLSPW